MSARPRLLDLFCGAGGAAMGYYRAGFDVVGVDIKPQPHFPFEFVQADALRPPFDLRTFDAIHASPPCQAYSVLAAMHPERSYERHIERVRASCEAAERPFVIENVETAPLESEIGLFGSHGLLLCGTSFGLGARGMELRRHRLFESNVPLAAMPCRHRLRTIGVYGHGGHTGKHRMAYRKEASEALGIDWMNRDEMCQAIPPAYTEICWQAINGVPAMNCKHIGREHDFDGVCMSCDCKRFEASAPSSGSISNDAFRDSWGCEVVMLKDAVKLEQELAAARQELAEAKANEDDAFKEQERLQAENATMKAELAEYNEQVVEDDNRIQRLARQSLTEREAHERLVAGLRLRLKLFSDELSDRHKYSGDDRHLFDRIEADILALLPVTNEE